MIQLKISHSRNEEDFFERNTNSSEPPCFFPRENIFGEASWSIAKEPRRAEIRLFWYTKGKGDKDVQIVDKIELENIEKYDKKTFSFTLPDSPYSFSGKLISLIWAIEIVFFPTKESEILEFTMSSTGKEIALYESQK